ncbi:tripartite tricarboxylate transporter substrate binding protein [Ramlibacter sp.]|uniref:tripartite tricarboxylate transporter substrate binding protein n=1 Tax=Ramlibacter sp. TaxID=1917967 RepID=UPI00262E7424|nr:tripartite tricarboxylate transporter substrate binding protein [Ramlibacter sp.]MDB5954090.1 tripartite tricarboxylate transporter substrate binding protein [Ramlibacter sp.]
MQSFVFSKLFCRLLLVVLALSLPGAAFAQAWPAHPIRMVVPFSAGAGVTDIMARLVAKHLSDSLGQPVVIDNRPGAGGIAGTDAVAKAAPDGYTFLVSNVAHTVDPYLYSRLPFDPVADFIPVTMINSAPLLLVVHPSVPVTSVKELVAYAKTHPGKLNYGSGGVGTTPHLAGELFKSLSGIDAVHVPYKGGAPALNDLMAGQLTYMIENVPGTMPFVKAGRLRALAITSAQRSPLVPALPTMAEAGVPGYEVIGWNAIFAVKGTPPAIVARLQTEVARILRLPEVRQQMAALGAEPIGNTPEEFSAFLKTETARWGKVIKEKGIRAD